MQEGVEVTNQLQSSKPVATPVAFEDLHGPHEWTMRPVAVVSAFVGSASTKQTEEQPMRKLGTARQRSRSRKYDKNKLRESAYIRLGVSHSF